MFIRQGSKKLTQSIVLTALLIGSGCARYVSLAAANVPVGQDVRLELTPAGATKLGGSIGERARYVQGRLTGNAPNGDMIVAASTLVRDNGSEETLNGIEVTLPTDAIAQIQWRQLDPARSALALAATIGGALVVGRAVSGSSGIFGRGGGSGGKTQ
jgi:hypothetical protein